MSRIADILLKDELTSRIAIHAVRQIKNISVKWELLIGGSRHSFGMFLIASMDEDGSEDFLLSADVPDLPADAEAVLCVRMFDENGDAVCEKSFTLPPPCRLGLLPDDQHVFCGSRYNVSQAFISSGKLSAVIDACGMREMRFNGEKLMHCGPKIALWKYSAEKTYSADLQLDDLRMSPDRFVAVDQSIECHALALPRKMELDELEFTQRFTPQENGFIRCDFEFVVPECFSGIPRLGVEMRLDKKLDKWSYSSGNGDGDFVFKPDGEAGNIPRYHNVSRLSVSDASDSRELHIFGGYEYSFSVMPFSEYELLDAAENGTAPMPDGEIHLFIDCRTAEKNPIHSGVYRMTLFISGN